MQQKYLQLINSKKPYTSNGQTFIYSKINGKTYGFAVIAHKYSVLVMENSYIKTDDKGKPILNSKGRPQLGIRKIQHKKWLQLHRSSDLKNLANYLTLLFEFDVHERDVEKVFREYVTQKNPEWISMNKNLCYIRLSSYNHLHHKKKDHHTDRIISVSIKELLDSEKNQPLKVVGLIE